MGHWGNWDCKLSVGYGLVIGYIKKVVDMWLWWFIEGERGFVDHEVTGYDNFPRNLVIAMLPLIIQWVSEKNTTNGARWKTCWENTFRPTILLGSFRARKAK